MKNRNLILGLIFALLIIVFGVGAYFLSQNKTATNSAKQEIAKPTNSTKSAESTLKDLLASKVPSKCTYSTDAGATKISGTVYVAGGKVRGDFTTTSGKTEITGHMATDAKYVYTWTDGSKQGYKFATDTITNAKTEANTQQPDFNQKFNYSCSPWLEDSKMLELPKDVTFTVFSIPTVPTGTTGTSLNNQAACQACASLPAGETKTACLTQLKCN